MPNQITFTKAAVATAYLADQFYIFEADITPGAHYDDVGALVMAGAAASGAADPLIVEYIGSIQKPGLDWSGKLNNLWLIFKNSSNTDAGNFAIVMDMEDEVTIPSGDNIFSTLIGSPFHIRLKRLIYSHNLEPNLNGSSGKAILGKDEYRENLEPVIDWPHLFKAGIIYQLAIGFGGKEIDFPYVDALPRAMMYDKTGKAVVDSGVTTGLDYVKNDYDGQIKDLKRKDKAAREAGKTEGKLTDKEKDQLKKLKKHKKDVGDLKDLMLQPNLMVGGTGIKNIIITNKGQSLNIKFSIIVKVGPVTGKVLGFQILFKPAGSQLLDWGVTGVGLDIKKPPTFSLSGALLFNPKEFPDFKSISGGLSLGLTRWSILVLAAYDEVKVAKDLDDTYTSLFAFGFLGGELINILGIVTINGVALTFGFNRHMRLPTDMGELPSHPIIKAASSVPAPKRPKKDTKPTPDDPNDLPATRDKPGEEDDPNKAVEEGMVAMVKSIKTYVPTKQGSFFAGFGLRADIVKLIDLFLMPVVTIEMDPEKDMPNFSGMRIQLFGMASLSLPKDIDEDIAPLVLKLAIGAEIEIPKLKVLIGGSLFDSVLRVIPDVELSIEGGFAFLYKEGSFVFTVGGYGTIQTPEPGWPVVDPISLRFNPVDNVELAAELYFFVTNKYLGIGFDINGRANISFSRVEANASFSIGLNALIQFDPFYFKVEAHANFHLQVSVDYYLSSASKSLDLQAQLVAIYGKGVPFSGWAEIHLHILFSFTVDVDWGNRVDGPQPLTWDEYLDKFIRTGEKEQNLLRLSSSRLTGGLQSQKDDYFVVEPNALELETEVFFPCTSALINGEQAAIASEEASALVGIQMMGITHDTYKNTMQPVLEVKLMDGEGNLLDEIQRANFSVEVMKEDFPTALWKPAQRSGWVPKPDPHGPDTVKNAIKGLRIKAHAPIAGVGHDIPKDNLAFDLTFADEVEMYVNEALSIGEKTTELAVTDSMVAHRPDEALLEAMGLPVEDVAFTHLTAIDLQAVPYLD